MERDPRSTHQCAGNRILEFRKRLGLTQKELAARAGYSERLVRKGEKSKALQWVAIGDLAGALSVNGYKVTPEELINCPEQMARLIMAAWSEHEANWLPHIAHLLADNAVLRCAGDPEKIPFAGEWHGHDGFDKWAKCFYATLTRPDKNFYQPTYIASGNTVVAWGQELAHVPGIPFPPIWVTQRFVFEESKLILFEDLFDTEGGSAHIAEARARQFLD